MANGWQTYMAALDGRADTPQTRQARTEKNASGGSKPSRSSQMKFFATWLTVGRRHWLALAAVLLYLGRWAQYAVEAAAYRTQPASGGAGDALNWLLLGQLFFAGGLGLVLLASAWRHRAQWRFYLGLAGVVALPFAALLLLSK